MNDCDKLTFMANHQTRTRVIIALVITAVIGGGAWAWDSQIKPRVIVRKWNVVEPGSIYRSGQISRYLIEDTLKKHDIRTIIFLSEDKDLTEGVSRPDLAAEREAAKKLGIERFNYPLRGDGTGDIVQYANAVEKIVQCQKQFKPVLVHCHTGSQRTGATIAFYQLLIRHRPTNEVYRDLIDNEHDPEDNPKLIPYVNQNIAVLAKMLVERGVMDKVPEPMPQLNRTGG